MSVDKAFREMIRNEIEAQLRPIQAAVVRLESSADLVALRDLAVRLAPLLGTKVSGRPAGRLPAGRKIAGAKAGPGRRRRVDAGGDRSCALIGCRRPARSKGYCAAHYQKFRMLTRTNRRPADWVEYAPPNSVEDVVLPRGRAAAKALRAAKESS